MNTFAQVNELAPGTVFRVGTGSPWLRTNEGVVDLLVLRNVNDTLGDRMRVRTAIPTVWQQLSHKVTVLFEEKEA